MQSMVAAEREAEIQGSDADGSSWPAGDRRYRPKVRIHVYSCHARVIEAVLVTSTINDFLHGLFGQGAFNGQTPREAYFANAMAT